VTAASKEKVLDALARRASKLPVSWENRWLRCRGLMFRWSRRPTFSLEALKAYSLGRRAFNEKGSAASLPYHQRAIGLVQILPWATRQWELTIRISASLGRASERIHDQSIPVAGHASEREKLQITPSTIDM